MTEHDALLAAVLADPEDDLPRLVYADWLEENGQGELAEFIRVQCEMGRAPKRHGAGAFCQCRRCVLYRRECELLDEYAYLWFPPPLVACLSPAGTHFRVPTPGMVGAHVTRGFAGHIACTLADWLSVGPAVVRSHPVTSVVLTDREPDDNGGAAVWWFSDATGRSDGTSAFVRDPIFYLLAGHAAGFRNSRYYPTREAALSALSAALIAWAKSQPHPARLSATPVSVDLTHDADRTVTSIAFRMSDGGTRHVPDMPPPG